MQDFTTTIDGYFGRLKNTLDGMDRKQIVKVTNLFLDALKEGRTIFTMGNGGSASTASHLCGDFSKGASYRYKQRFRMVCLNDNLATLMAYANDVSYDSVFEEPLKNLLRPGDLVLGISGSGNSENILRGIKFANENQATTVGFCGYDGGRLKRECHHVVHVPVNDMQITEDVHLMLGHLMMQIFCRENSVE